MRDFFTKRIGGSMRIEASGEVFFVGVKSAGLTDVNFSVSRAPTNRSPESAAIGLGTVRVSYRSATTPGALVQSAIAKLLARSGRAPGPASRPDAETPHSSADAQAQIRGQIAKLSAGEGVGSGEQIPTPGSIQRLMQFVAGLSGIIPPDVFPTRTGALKCRWGNGSQSTITLLIPSEGDVSALVMCHRDGERGIAKFTVRYQEINDTPELARRFGVRIV